MSRRDVITGSVLGTTLLGPAADGMTMAAQSDDAQVAQALRQLVNEVQISRRSTLAGEVGPANTLRDHMLQFLKSTNKWPDMIDVGPGVWFTMYDWHIRFGQSPVVTRLPDGRYGLTFMFTILVLRQEQTRDYIGVAYDKER